MTRAARARRIAAAAAVGGGGIGALGATAYGVLALEARMARRWIGQPFDVVGPGGQGLYGHGTEPITLVMLGDSSSIGIGADRPDHAPGVVIARGLSSISGRPVRLHLGGVSGAESSALPGQLESVLAEIRRPDVAVIMVGANDVTHRIRPSDAVRSLDVIVRRLRERGTEVVVATCPDLGTIRPIAHPLRWFARRASRELAAAQTIATVEAGGRTVSLGDLLGPEFEASPAEMFSSDRFHPSAAGYARAAHAILPSVASALGYAADAGPGRGAAVGGQERVEDIAAAAVEAVDAAGTEVSGTSVAGAQRGPRGRWALLRLRRGSSQVTSQVTPGETPEPDPPPGAPRDHATSS